jgi:hypothetical protein
MRVDQHPPAPQAWLRRRRVPWTNALVLMAVCGACASMWVRQARAGNGNGETRAKETEAKVKVAYVYNFPKFIDWPRAEKRAAAEPVRICLIGTDPIRTFLGELSIRKVNGRPIEVAHIEDLNALTRCHLLFVSRSEELHLPLVLQRVQKSPVLTVSDISRFAYKGGMIGFVTEKGRVKIEVNQKSVRVAGLKIRAKLLEIARIVQ